jgi:hypothetical protein
MKQGFIAMVIVAIPLAIILFGKATTCQRDSVTIHIHDTYLILPHWHLAIFVVSILMFAFGATAACFNAFKKTGYNLLGIAGLLCIVGMWLYISDIF